MNCANSIIFKKRLSKKQQFIFFLDWPVTANFPLYLTFSFVELPSTDAFHLNPILIFSYTLKIIKIPRDWILWESTKLQFLTCNQVPEVGNEHGSAWPFLHLAHSGDWTCWVWTANWANCYSYSWLVRRQNVFFRSFFTSQHHPPTQQTPMMSLLFSYYKSKTYSL